MKKYNIALTCACLMAFAALTSACGNGFDDLQPMSNGVELSIDGNAFMYENDERGVAVKAFMAFAQQQEVRVELMLEGNEGDIAHLETPTITFAPGQKTASVRVVSNNKHALTSPRTLAVSIVSASNNNVKAANSGVKITVNPEPDVPQLTPQQLQLIQGYKEKYGIDLTRMLGKVDVEAVVTFNTDDKEQFFGGQATQTFKDFSIITLDENATPDKPMIRMTANAMGITSLLYNVLKRKTVEDTEFFLAQPYGKAVVDAVKYNPSQETFETWLNGITLIPDNNSISFTGIKHTATDDEITAVPFGYRFSAWERVKKLVEQKATVVVEEHGKQVEYVLDNDFLQQGASFAPERWLGASDISADAYGTSPTTWISAEGHFDFKRGTFSFSFPWDFDGANGYQQVRVTYTMHP